MILQRVEKDGVIKGHYDSSNIVASSYNKTTKDLNVTFKNGGSYTYQGVSESDFMRFETADSQGKVINTNIKKYPFLKHDNVEVDDIIKEIKTLKDEATKALETGLVDAMREAVKAYDEKGAVANVGTVSKIAGLYLESAKTV